MKLTGKMMREYLSITLTSLIFGMDTRNTDAPLRRACSTCKVRLCNDQCTYTIHTSVDRVASIEKKIYILPLANVYK